MICGGRCGARETPRPSGGFGRNAAVMDRGCGGRGAVELAHTKTLRLRMPGRVWGKSPATLPVCRHDTPCPTFPPGGHPRGRPPLHDFGSWGDTRWTAGAEPSQSRAWRVVPRVGGCTAVTANAAFRNRGLRTTRGGSFCSRPWGGSGANRGWCPGDGCAVRFCLV